MWRIRAGNLLQSRTRRRPGRCRIHRLLGRNGPRTAVVRPAVHQQDNPRSSNPAENRVPPPGIHPHRRQILSLSLHHHNQQQRRHRLQIHQIHPTNDPNGKIENNPRIHQSNQTLLHLRSPRRLRVASPNSRPRNESKSADENPLGGQHTWEILAAVAERVFWERDKVRPGAQPGGEAGQEAAFLRRGENPGGGSKRERQGFEVDDRLPRGGGDEDGRSEAV
ncbi:unnamed protein product [Linum tenue]|uniref:Uncharacterized protein n=1 Tax=Linum tenue TaxID=586396 RepID=A0AAV0R673_9ROSI|nr:unnamed protein product [Linum tenue]CAI0553005.1 unnamed protein product [Linum tenue]